MRLASRRSPPERTLSMRIENRAENNPRIKMTTRSSIKVNPQGLLRLYVPIGDVGVFTFTAFLAVAAIRPQIEILVVNPRRKIEVFILPRIPGHDALFEISALSPLLGDTA
jgi:hypothetical protein